VLQQVGEYLTHLWGMSKSLIENLAMWSDLQSLVFRTSESEINLKPKFARDLYRVVSSLFKWHRSRSNCGKALEVYLQRFPKLLQGFEDELDEFAMRRVGDDMLGSSLRDSAASMRKCGNRVVDDIDVVEATDAGGEEDISVSSYNVLDQETETEMVVDPDGDDGRFEDVDDDSEADPNELNPMHMVGYSFT